jgi:ATP adenylyltransferase
VRSGSLVERVREVSDQALRSGALEPIATRSTTLEDRGVPFEVRVLERIAKKKAGESAQRVTGRNPFLPYEDALFVADLSRTHVAVLNKFNVLDRHLLAVTRQFEEQESLLTPSDFEAISIVFEGFESLFFYNAGPAGGASQRHKHLQFVPVPLGPGPERCPMERLFVKGGKGELPPFPAHFVSAAPSQAFYLEALERFGRRSDPRAYNLVATRDWTLFVPRTRDRFESLSVNGLGFAGAMLVKDAAELTRLEELGPMRVLEEVSSR